MRTAKPNWLDHLSRRSLFAAALALAIISGCGPAVVETKATPAAEKLYKIKDAFEEFLAQKRRMPKSTEDLEPYLKAFGDPTDILTSPNDGQPFVILWNVNFNEAAPSDKNPQPISRIYVHEKDGSGGYRHVLFASGVVTKLTQAQFEKSPLAKP